MNALGGYLGFNIFPKAFLSCKLEIKALTIELVDNLLYVPGHRLPLRFFFRSILNYHQAELCESVTTLPWPCMSKSHECHNPQGCWALIKCFSVAAHQCSFI